MHIKDLYKKLLTIHGPQHWWPVKSSNPELEICIGAILTQNTAWRNVEKSINELLKRDLFNEEKLLRINTKELALLIKSSGYYNQKAKRIKNFIHFYINNKDRLRKEELIIARNLLLSLKGIGKETADSMLLYAFNRKIFPVDIYTIRLFHKLGLIESLNKEKHYEQVRSLVEPLFSLQELKEFHALIVEEGKQKYKNI